MSRFSTGKDRAFVQPGPLGTVLTSNGAGLNPSYQANSGGATPGASGTVLTSNGPSVAPSYQAPSAGLILKNTVTLTAAQILALAETPIIVVPAPAVGFFLIEMFCMLQYHFVTTPYATVTGNLALQYSPGAVTIGSGSVPGTAWADQSVDTYNNIPNSSPFGLHPTSAQCDNKAIAIFNEGADWTAGDGTIDVTTYYAVLASF